MITLAFVASAVLQISSAPLDNTTAYPQPSTRYQFVASVESDAPVALCDEQFNCHCPAGYDAVVQQAHASAPVKSVICQPTATSSKQLRETYDSYPALPKPSTYEK